MSTWSSVLISGITIAAVGAVVLPAMAQTPPDYYVGAGARFGFNDDTAFMLDSKAKLTDLGDLSLSARPALLFGNNTELRLPLSVEGAIHEGIFPYGGAGISYNADGNSSVDPMITGGVDFELGRNLVLDVGVNVVFKAGNTDTELATTLNYRF